MAVQKTKKSLPPLKVIENKPYRKSRSEILLRILMSSSYSHALLGNLTLELARGYGMSDDDDLNTTAKHLRESERELSILDFIRCVELKYVNGVVNVQAKRLKNIESLTVISDGVDTHETTIESNMAVPDFGTLHPEKAHSVATMLLMAFYRSQVSGAERHREPTHIDWVVRERRVAEDLYVQGAVKKNLSMTDLKIQSIETLRPFNEVLALLVQSLQRVDFNIILTQNRLLIKDQGIRIHLDRPKSNRNR